MASNITLSAGVRQNLLSLQSTAQMMSLTQNRLATGKKVNSALDNPTNYFTSQSLQNRASDLNGLLDSIGQAQQTLKAADTGISSLTKLVESAKSIAKQALGAAAATATYAQTVTGGAIAADSEATVTGTVGSLTTGTALNAVSLGLATGETISVSDGTNTTTFTVGADPSAQTVQDVLTALNGGAATWTASVNGDGEIEIASNNANDTITVSGTGAAKAGFGTGNTTADPTNSTLSALAGQSLSIAVGSGSANTFNITASTTRADVDSWLGGLSLGTGITASLTSGGAIEIASTSSENITIGGTAASALGFTAPGGVYEPTGTVTTPSATRANLQQQYNDLLTQIDALARDASYNGINLLSGDNLKVVFNEDGSSSQTINGVDFTSSGLNLTALSGDEFQANSSLDTVLAGLDSALSSLRTQAAKFGSNLTTVQTRQDFTKNMINTLQTGADALVLADTNEEGANLLALQTRQQLSTTALSMAAQADQAVLRLF